jgi:organic radical activating enzyme
MSEKVSPQDYFSFSEELNKVSPSFCLAKWKQVTLHLHNGRTHSCHHPYPHPIQQDEVLLDPSALHNTEYKKQQRKLMLEGKRPSECQYCWNVEDTEAHKQKKIFSDRIAKSAETWANTELSKISKLPWAANINPSYVEVSFSSVCNFSCSYCSPVYSSKWHEEVLKHGPYPTSARYNNLEYFQSQGELSDYSKKENFYVEAFWKWWPNLAPDLKVFRITGGEPLLSPDTFKILDFLEINPLPNLHLAINTNAGAPSVLFDRFVSKLQNLISTNKVKSFELYISLDGVGPQAEYSRHGLNYSIWLNNLEQVLQKIDRVAVTIMCTTNVFSILSYSELVQKVYELKLKHRGKRVTLDSSILRFPHHLNLTILTDEFKNIFDASLDFMQNNLRESDVEQPQAGFSTLEVNRLRRLIEYFRSGPSPQDSLDIHTARADFYLFVNEHDLRRGTNFNKTFPALNNFYLECKKAYLSNPLK